MRRAILLIVGVILFAAPAAVRAANTYSVVIDPSVTWTQAKAAAALAGGYLATITTQAEQTAVLAQIALASPANGGFWIGLKRAAPCCFQWDTNETTCFTHFYYAEPNDGAGQGGPTEDRGQMIWNSTDASRKGFWNDVPDAGYASLGDISRRGYVIEFGGLDGSVTCATCVGPDVASGCYTPPGGSVTAQTKVIGVSTGPGKIGRTIIDISSPPPAPSQVHLFRTQASYSVSCTVPTSVSAGVISTMLRDSINAQIGGSGFHSSIALTDTAIVRMYRSSGNFSSTDNNTIPSVTLVNMPPAGAGAGGGHQGPLLSPFGVFLLAFMLTITGALGLRIRRRTSL